VRDEATGRVRSDPRRPRDRNSPSRGGGVKTSLHNRPTAANRDPVAPDTGPMTSSISNQQPSTIRGEAQS
jgi:hypothetical protein